jgi:tetraacyldisaccharide 4'-kinase
MQAPGFWWRKSGAAAALLSPFAAIYGSVAGRRLAQNGERAGVPVICIGNPTVGGAGKTPAAIAVARLLIAAGGRPAFLTRGYGGKLAGPVQVETSHTADGVGDEPLLLARVARTIVSRDRAAGARHAITAGATVIVMDDGFQNPSLAKDLSILVIDAARGIGNGHVIPAGPLRAPLAPQLERAHAILIVGDGAGAVPTTNLPTFHARLEPDRAALASLKNRRVLAFAGIGDPQKFFATLAAAGINAQIQRGFADHHRYRPDEAAALIAEAERHDLVLVTTEKDLARLQGDPALAALASRVQVLPVEMIVSEQDDFRRLVVGATQRA